MMSLSNNHDNGLNLLCGKSTTQHIQFQPPNTNGTSTSSSSCAEDDDACWNRSYKLYLSTKICDAMLGTAAAEETMTSTTTKSIGIVPLVFAVHCFGCTSGGMVKWEEIAEEYGFALVRPEGKNDYTICSM